jgi:hypothetical protein
MIASAHQIEKDGKLIWVKVYLKPANYGATDIVIPDVPTEITREEAMKIIENAPRCWWEY